MLNQNVINSSGKTSIIPHMRMQFLLKNVEFVKILLAAVFFLVPFYQIEPIKAEDAMIVYTARIIGDEERIRLLLEFNEEPDFSIGYLQRPNRIVIDLKKTQFGFSRDALSPRGLLSDLRYGSMSGSQSRLILTLKQPAVLEDIQLQILEEGHHRLVLDINASVQSEFDAVIREQEWDALKPRVRGERIRLTESDKSDKFVLVLDAGHGGIDGGAEGQKGTIEKDITLAFVEALKKELEGGDDLEIVLTRNNDSFLSLSARVQIARKMKADLFVSIHADSIWQKALRGASVYTLSQKASDGFSALLAEAENRTDILAGLDIEDSSDEVTKILLDLASRETQSLSNRVADHIIDKFDGQIELLKNPHRRAKFRVLQAPDVPSILVELGFLSNLIDEQLLLDLKWRERVIKLLAQSINKYKNLTLSTR